MLLFLKSSSRTVHHYHDEQEQYHNNYTNQESSVISLTVWRKSLLFNCKGFTVIASDGSLVYRVDNYNSHPNQIILMDGSGNPIFTICRHKHLMRLMDNYWLVYEGEVDSINSLKKPIFCVKKNISIMRRKQKASVLAYVYSCLMSEERYVYMIEGSYEHRCCKILDESRRVVGEIKKKEALKGGVDFGLEVFNLIVMPGIDSRLAMAIVLLLDQMFS